MPDGSCVFLFFIIKMVNLAEQNITFYQCSTRVRLCYESDTIKAPEVILLFAVTVSSMKSSMV